MRGWLPAWLAPYLIQTSSICRSLSHNSSRCPWPHRCLRRTHPTILISKLSFTHFRLKRQKIICICSVGRLRGLLHIYGENYSSEKDEKPLPDALGSQYFATTVQGQNRAISLHISQYQGPISAYLTCLVIYIFNHQITLRCLSERETKKPARTQLSSSVSRQYLGEQTKVRNSVAAVWGPYLLSH